MKNILYCAAAVFAAVSVLASCSKDQSKEPQLVIDQQVVEFGEEGGEGKITYTLLNTDESDGISLTGVPEWISDPVTSVKGEISFTVAANSGESREALLTVVCGTLSGEFTVRQGEFLIYPSAEGIAGKVIKATWCQFDPDKTQMLKFNNVYKWAETDADGDFVFLTMGEWAQDYIDKYNEDNPGENATVEDVMAFDFTDRSSGVENYMYIKTDTEGNMECWSGSQNEYGNVGVMDMGGSYTYDASTGIMVVADTKSNTTYTCVVTLQFRRVSDKIYELQVLSYEDYKWADGSPVDGHPYQPWLNVYGGDNFPFMLRDYSDPDRYSWQPLGEFVYTCSVKENV